MRNSLVLAALLLVSPAVSAKGAKPPPKTKGAAVQPAPAAEAPAPMAAAAPGGKCRPPVKATCASAKVAFAPAVVTPYAQSAGDSPAMFAADVNNDGKTDLLVSHTDGFIDVLLSKGDGSFELAKKAEVRVSGYGLVAADFDGDCNLDILASSFGTASVGSSVDLLAGKGTGSFRLPQNFPISASNVITMVLTDVNGDRRLDVAFDGNSGGGPGIIMGTGKGKFTPPVAFHPKSAWTFGDVTGDGAAELIYVDSAGDVPAMCISENNGRGQFADQKCYPLTANATGVATRVGDVNGDGKADVVVLTKENAMHYNVFINLGGGKFDEREKYELGYANAFLIADANNDGKADLIAYRGTTGGGLIMHFNKGDGTFGAKPEIYPSGSDSSRAEELLVAGDWLGNGLVGFATVDRLKDGVSVVAAECRE